MLQITVPAFEVFDESTGSINEIKECTLSLEHSLISISKWEAKWKKPFLGREPKTPEQSLDYIRCMTLNPKVDPLIYSGIRPEQVKEINDYVNDSQTATWFNDQDRKVSREIITSELIYYWMVAAEIPFECQKWHLNRLMTLIKVCSIKNEESMKSTKSGKGKKPSQQGMSNAAINAARRKALGSKG